MLWLCIHLPWLPLAVFERGNGGGEPLAVVEGRRIVQPNTGAIRAGVTAGMGLAAAQALVPHLHRRERDTTAERALLERLAGWALQYSAEVSPEPPASLLLEIGGSLRYFSGLESLRGRIEDGLAALGHRPRPGIAPTPTAASLLARAGAERPLTHATELRDGIAELPIEVLDLDERQRQALAGLGLTGIGDCLALPRDGLARRFGPGLLDQLDRALGHAPDPQPRWQPPAQYDDRLELPAEVSHTDHLIFGLNRLIRGFCGFLRGGERGTQRLRIQLDHRHQSATPFSIGLVAPSRDPDHLMDLTRQRLERIRLPAPVIGLGLSSRDIQPLPPGDRALIEDPHVRDRTAGEGLVDRLTARLGERTIRGLGTHAEHRPEHAWRYQPPGGTSPAVPTPERPLWLLAQPLRLTAHDGRPHWQGPLTLVRGPERIESGWWDGGDVARDYYIATTPAGERLWIYRNRRGQREWYLHGLFG